MPLIPKAPAPPDKESIPVRLDRTLHAQLRDYAAFVQGSKDYVIAGALQRLFKNDREFAEWLEARAARASTDAGADRASAPTESPAVTTPRAAAAPQSPQPGTPATATNSRPPRERA